MGKKKQKIKAGPKTSFCIEIKISKTSLSQPIGISTTVGSLSDFLRAARRDSENGTRRTTLRGVANVSNISKTIAEFENKIANWDKEPITDELLFILYVCGNLPHEISRNKSYYVVDYEKGEYRIRFSGHNAESRNFIGRIGRYKVGITFKQQYERDTFVPHPGIYYKEHVYYSNMLESCKFKNILQGVVNVLKGGEYDVDCDFIRYSPSEEKYLKKYPDTKGVSAQLNGISDPGLRSFVEDIDFRLYMASQKMNFSDLKKCASQYFRQLPSDVEIMNYTESVIVQIARRISRSNGSIRNEFEQLKALYDIQPIIKPKDGTAKSLQQYSTPCPIAYLASKFVAGESSKGKTFLEPSAGNGMLTIALNDCLVDVNDLDDVRYNNLRMFSPERFNVFHEDGAKYEFPNYGQYDGIITNPPFDSLSESEYLKKEGTKNGVKAVYTFKELDHKMAIHAIDHMSDNGRAAIIIGGKMGSRMDNHKNAYWNKYNMLFGAFNVFVQYLNRQYNLIDIIYINGDMYHRQGTDFPIVMLLVDGRKQWDDRAESQWHEYDERLDSLVNSYEELFLRMLPHIEKSSAVVDNNKTKRVRIAKAKAKSALALAQANNK